MQGWMLLEEPFVFMSINVVANTSEANFQRQLWVLQMKKHYEAKIYFTDKPWIVLFNVVKVFKDLS